MPAPLSLDIRQTIMELIESGISQADIADELSVSRSAVTSLNRHYKTHGHIFPIRPPGNNPTFSEEDHIIIKQIVEKEPELTLAEYAQAFFEKTDKPLMSESTICRILKKLNLPRKKKSKHAEERDRGDVKKKSGSYKFTR